MLGSDFLQREAGLPAHMICKGIVSLISAEQRCYCPVRWAWSIWVIANGERYRRGLLAYKVLWTCFQMSGPSSLFSFKVTLPSF